MALKKCKECGNQVSTKADKCPKCGAPVIALRTDFRRRSEIHDSGINFILYYGSKKHVEALTDPVGNMVEVVREFLRS